MEWKMGDLYMLRNLLPVTPVTQVLAVQCTPLSGVLLSLDLLLDTVLSDILIISLSLQGIYPLHTEKNNCISKKEEGT